jgi:hypothetical protein
VGGDGGNVLLSNECVLSFCTLSKCELMLRELIGLQNWMILILITNCDVMKFRQLDNNEWLDKKRVLNEIAYVKDIA